MDFIGNSNSKHPTARRPCFVHDKGWDVDYVPVTWAEGLQKLHKQ